MLDACKQQKLYRPVNNWDFRETGACPGPVFLKCKRAIKRATKMIEILC